MRKESKENQWKSVKRLRKAGTGILLATFLTVSSCQPAWAAAPTETTQNKEAQTSRYVPTPEDIRLTKDIVQLDSNGYYSAAVMNNGDLYTWGTMTRMLDEMSWGYSGESKDPGLFAQNVAKVVLSDSANAYIDKDGNLYMWGPNAGGMIGDPKLGLNYEEPVKMLENVQDVMINALKRTVAAITKDGDLYMWGDNWVNTIGGQDQDESLGSTVYEPFHVELPGKVTKVSMDSQLTGALLENGDCYMWGNLNSEEIEHFAGEEVHRGTPVKVAEHVQDMQIVRGIRSYLTEDGNIYTWGDNPYKELGRVTETSEDYIPGKVENVSDIVSYRLGSTSLALKSDGTLYGWGMNESGTVGNGTQTTVVTPVPVLENVQSIIPGKGQDSFATISAVIDKNQSLWMWGRNNPLAIGNGNSSYQETSPVKILDSVTGAVSCAGLTLATCSDGSMWGWGGYNYRKSIGDFTEEERAYPVVVTLYGPSPSVKNPEDPKDPGENPGSEPGEKDPGENVQQNKKKVQKITVSTISNKIAAGKSATLRAEIKPANATVKKVQWKSSNTKYATVNSKGKVTTKKAGAGKSVTITAYALDGSRVKGSYKIQIKKHAVKSVSLKAASATVKAGKSVQVKATVKTTGKDANKALRWCTSTTKYATVNSKGKVTTKKAGKGKKVKVTAIAMDGTGKQASVTIKIK